MTNMDYHISRTRARWLENAMQTMEEPQTVDYWVKTYGVCQATVYRVANRINRVNMILSAQRPTVVRVGPNSRLSARVPHSALREAGLTNGTPLTVTAYPGRVTLRGEQ